MDRKTVVIVPCTLRRGAFPHERAFVIPFPDGSEYRGVVPAEYCFNSDRKPLGDAPTGEAVRVEPKITRSQGPEQAGMSATSVVDADSGACVGSMADVPSHQVPVKSPRSCR